MSLPIPERSADFAEATLAAIDSATTFVGSGKAWFVWVHERMIFSRKVGNGERKLTLRKSDGGKKEKRMVNSFSTRLWVGD